MIRKALVADDSGSDRELMIYTLNSLSPGLEILTASDGARAIRLLNEDSFDAVFTDLKMPEADGLSVLEQAQKTQENASVVIITGHGEVSSAVEAMKKGCFDYLQKPISIEQVEVVLNKLIEHRRLVEENAYLRSELSEDIRQENLIGKSSVFRRICSQAAHVGAADATVLLQGESGTGKEVVSRLIHDSSPRNKGPFIRVNCAALSESLLESELFGHVRGAFTGAHNSRPGRFELADGGTIMLDEVTETSEKLQAELLRVIEEKEFERVGGSKTISVDVRVIATTNRDIHREVNEERFREDLFYRLNVVPIVIPPLRERDGDVSLLCEKFTERFAARMGKESPVITAEAMKALNGWRWPGNVRELMNLAQRLVIMDDDGIIELTDLPDNFIISDNEEDSRSALVGTLDEIERRAILSALRESGGNRTLAAEKLNISTRTVRNKLKKYMTEGRLPENLSPPTAEIAAYVAGNRLQAQG